MVNNHLLKSVVFHVPAISRNTLPRLYIAKNVPVFCHVFLLHPGNIRTKKLAGEHQTEKLSRDGPIDKMLLLETRSTAIVRLVTIEDFELQTLTYLP